MLHRPLYRRKAGYSFIRSLNPAAWFRADTGVTVTGLGASTVADQSGNGRDLLQSTDASRPPYLSYSASSGKYLYLPGVAGNYASTPDSAAADVTGDIDIKVRLSMVDWTPAADSSIVAKWQAAGQFSYLFRVAASGFLRFLVTNDGTSTAGFDVTSSAANTFTDGGDGWIRVTRASASGDVTFYTGGTESTPTWVQLGTVKSTTAATMKSGTSIVELGSNTGGTLSLASANIYRASIYSTIGGTTPVVDFNPNLDGSDQAATITSSATGEVWTINKSGGLPAQIVGRPSLLFDGTADYLKCNAFTLNQPETVYIAFKQVSWTGADYVFDGNALNTGNVTQFGTTPNLVFAAATANIDFTGEAAIGTYSILSTVFNGASSVGQINNQTPATGNPGAANMGGLTLGAAGTAGAYSNIQVLEVLVFSTAHDATQRARVIQYLAGRAGISL